MPQYGDFMHASQARRRRALQWADWLLALLLAGSAQYELWVDPFYEQASGTRWAHAVFLLLATLPLAWRRRAPLAVLVLVLVSISAQSLLLDDWTSFQPFVAVVVAVYSLGAHGQLRTAIVGAAIAAAVILPYQVVSVVQGGKLSDLPGPLIVLGAAWLVGRLVGGGRLEALRLRDRAAELERERDEQARLAVEQERARMARELHDIVAHAISLIVVQARAGRRTLPGEAAPTRESLDTIEQTGRQALAEMRRLVAMLRAEGEAPALAPQAGLRQLDTLVAQVSEAGLPVELEVEGEPTELPPGIDLAAYRVVQEALTNALKHAGPATARVMVRYRPEELEVEVVDTGSGTVSAGEAGHGLVGMKERISLYGGEIEAGREHARGFAVRARLPLQWAGS
jgi:signal transduction histidine kinase